MEPIVPSPDMLPIPAPLWLFRFLLLFTFILHLVPMNLVFGGSLLALISRLKAGSDERHARLAGRIAELMPIVVSLTVTLGVAPLLFAQVLYGHLFYSVTILMGRAWFAVIPILILAYYGVYILYFRKDRESGSRTIVAWVTTVLFLLIGFIYVNVMSLMLRPEAWRALYHADPGGGGMNWGDPTLVPRFLHMLFGAVAVAGVWIWLLGVRGKSGDGEWSAWARRYGGKIFVHGSLANVAIGFVYLVTLPKGVMMAFMGGNMAATALLGIGTVLSFILVAFGYRGVLGKGSPKALLFAVVLALPLLVVMVLMRHLARSASLDPYYSIADLAEATDWGPFFLFAVSLLVGLAVVVRIVKVALQAGGRRA